MESYCLVYFLVHARVSDQCCISMLALCMIQNLQPSKQPDNFVKSLLVLSAAMPMSMKKGSHCRNLQKHSFFNYFIIFSLIQNPLTCILDFRYLFFKMYFDTRVVLFLQYSMLCLRQSTNLYFFQRQIH